MQKHSYLQNIAEKVNKLEAKDDFKLQNINIDLLVPSEKNLYGIREVEQLAEDIKQNGLYHNLMVRVREDGKYEIISGERRYHALKSLGVQKVPCQVRELDDTDFEIMLIQANAKTRELTHSEKMKQIERLEELYKQKRSGGEKLEGKTRDLIGQDMGLSGVQVGRYMKISKELIPELKELLDQNKLTMSKADIIASMDTEEQQAMLEILKQNIDMTRDEIQQLKDMYKQNRNDFEKEKEEHLKQLQQEKEQLFKMREEISQEASELEEKKLEASKEEKGVHGEHLENLSGGLKQIEFNTQLYLIIKNLKEAARAFIIKSQESRTKSFELSEENKDAIRRLKANEIKFIESNY